MSNLTTEENFSISQINKAGDVIRKEPSSSDLFKENYAIINIWRLDHNKLLKRFDRILKRRTNLIKNVLIAQRLKRMPTIINRLINNQTDLSSMQDIVGYRAILKNRHDLDSFAFSLQRSIGKFKYQDKCYKNYTTCPKESGYRAIHFVYKYEYQGDKFIELQIRTELQHIWATTVETLGNVNSTDFKSSMGDEKLLSFFKLLSSAFAVQENYPKLTPHQSMSDKEIYKAVIDLYNKLKTKYVLVEPLSKQITKIKRLYNKS